MNRALLGVLALPLALLPLATPALAGETTGSAALSLAALVGAEDPSLAKGEKNLLAAYLNSHPDAAGPTATIVVSATRVDCRAGNVNITNHLCDLAFGKATSSLAGKPAEQLFATMAWAGIEGDGAAGTIHETVENLICSVEPKGVKSQDGSGAKCKWK